jgi:hypothetical protein
MTISTSSPVSDDAYNITVKGKYGTTDRACTYSIAFDIGDWGYLEAGELGYQILQEGKTKYNLTTGEQYRTQDAKATIGLAWNGGDQHWDGGTVNIWVEDPANIFTSISATPTSCTPSASGTVITVVGTIKLTNPPWGAYTGPRLRGAASANFPDTGSARHLQDVGWTVTYIN